MPEKDKIKNAVKDLMQPHVPDSTLENDTIPDEQVTKKLEEAVVQQRLLSLEQDRCHAHTSHEQHHKQRNHAFGWALTVIAFWLLFVINFMFYTLKTYDRIITPAVVMTLLGTTTVNILGLAFIIMYNLFPNNTKASVGPMDNPPTKPIIKDR